MGLNVSKTKFGYIKTRGQKSSREKTKQKTIKKNIVNKNSHIKKG